MKSNLGYSPLHFREAGLTAVVINATLGHVGEGEREWVTDTPLVDNTAFRKRVCLLAVDEVHLLDSWGDSFRKACCRSGIRVRFESNLVVVAMAATLLLHDVPTSW